MAVALGDIIRTSANFLWENASQVVNVFDHAVTTLGDGLSNEDFGEFMALALESLYGQVFGVVPDNLKADYVSSFNTTQDTPIFTGGWPTFDEGGNAGQGMPISDCGFSFARTDVKDVRGRKYWPAAVETDHSDGIWSVDTLAAYVDAGENWIAPNIEPTSGLIVSPGVRRTALGPPQMAEFNGVVTRSQVYPLKRRRPGVGG